VTLHHDTRKILYEHRPPEAWLASYGLLMNQKMFIAHLELPCRHWKRQNCGNLHCFTRSDWGCLPQFPLKCPSTAVARCGSADWDSFMVCVKWCSTTLLGILEQYVSGTMDRLMSTNSMACSFPSFKPLRFLSVKTPKVYCLHYRSHWHPGLGTTNTECICNDPYDTWNFPVSQEITVQACNILCWSSRCTLWALSLIVRRS
jgi:hypothetical protein